MKAPARGEGCPVCAKGFIRHHTAPGGAAHRYCTVCPTIWPLPNRLQRRRVDGLVMVAHAGFLGGGR